jgi:hypothetical protein
MSGLACTRKVTEDEDATELRLGPDFNEAACLSMAEVRLIQQSKIDDDTEAGVDTSTTQTRCDARAHAALHQRRSLLSPPPRPRILFFSNFF